MTCTASSPFEVSFPISGSVNTASLDINLKLQCKTPAYPQAVLADGIKGNLKDGVNCSFNTQAVQGNVKFYTKNGEMWLDIDSVAWGQQKNTDIKLLSLL